MMAWLHKKIQEQMADNSQVVPECKWSERDRAFYINSVAGLIKYKPKDVKDLNRFRDRWVNLFEQYRSTALNNKDLESMMFGFTNMIRKEERVKYTANIRTRLKGTAWTLRV
jgi:hypothetical protein